MPSKEIVRRIVRTGLKALAPLLAVTVGLVAFVYLKSSGPQPPRPHRVEKVYTVRTQKAHIGEHQPKLRLYGETLAGRKVELRALAAGKVLRIGKGLREGALVKKGETLLVVDDFLYKGAKIEAEAKILEAKARLQEIGAQVSAEQDAIKFVDEQLLLSKRDLDRAMRLVRRGGVTKQGADKRRLAVSERAQMLRNRRSALAVLQAKQAQEEARLKTLLWKLKQAERNLADTVLSAPFDAYVQAANANVGRLLNANDRVATLLDRNWIEVSFNLSDRQYGRILGDRDGLVGRGIKVTWRVGDRPQTYQARVERVAARISSETGGVAVYARLENPGGASPIRAGAFVEVIMPAKHYSETLRLPQTALYQRSRIYVVGADDRLVERRVELLGLDGAHVLVRGDIRPDERVVVSRMAGGGGGLKVRDLSQPRKRGGPKTSVIGVGEHSGAGGKPMAPAATISRERPEHG